MKLHVRNYDVNVHAIFEFMIPNIERAGVIVVVTVLSLNNARTKSKNELRCSSIFASSTPATTTNTDQHHIQISDSDSRFRFQIQISDLDSGFRFQIQLSHSDSRFGFRF